MLSPGLQARYPQPAEPARQPVHALVCELPRLLDGAVDRDQDEVLEHAYIFGVDRLWIDGYALDVLVAVRYHLHGPSAGRVLDGLIRQSLLGLLHLALDLLQLLHHVAGVGLLPLGLGVVTALGHLILPFLILLDDLAVEPLLEYPRDLGGAFLSRRFRARERGRGTVGTEKLRRD